MFVLELRRSVTGQSINRSGHSQGEVAAIEMAVKDSKRFQDRGGWGYFEFNNGVSSRAAFPATSQCNACHQANTATDNTFVQFYPTLLEIARAKGVLKAAYLETEKPVAKK
jgi:cytochrome c peroxidase